MHGNPGVIEPETQPIKANQQETIQKPASKNHQGLSYKGSIPIAQNPRDNSGTSPSDLFQQWGAYWQQRPETSALILGIHRSHNRRVHQPGWIVRTHKAENSVSLRTMPVPPGDQGSSRLVESASYQNSSFREISSNFSIMAKQPSSKKPDTSSSKN